MRYKETVEKEHVIVKQKVSSEFVDFLDGEYEELKELVMNSFPNHFSKINNQSVTDQDQINSIRNTVRNNELFEIDYIIIHGKRHNPEPGSGNTSPWPNIFEIRYNMKIDGSDVEIYEKERSKRGRDRGVGRRIDSVVERNPEAPDRRKR